MRKVGKISKARLKEQSVRVKDIVSAKQNRGFKITDMLSITISLIALSVSIMNVAISNRHFEELYSDNLTLFIDEKGNNHTTELLDGIKGIAPAFFSIEYSIIVSNNSSIPVSIIGVDIVTIENGKVETIGGLFKEGITSHEIPIIVSGKESIKLQTIVYYKMNENVFRSVYLEYFLSAHANRRREVFREFCRHIYRNEIDIFGGAIKYIEQGETYLLERIASSPQPIKRITFHTSTNRSFSLDILFY